MAKETINASSTLKIVEPDGGKLKGCVDEQCNPSDGQKVPRDYRRSSTGSFNKSLSRKGSIGKLTPPNSGQNVRASTGSCNDVVPNYLKASTGSCHDFCKYGGHHSFEPKARIPVRKRVTKPAPDHQSLTEMDREVKAAAKIKTSPKDASPDLPLQSETVVVPARQDSLNGKKMPQLVRNGNISGKPSSFKTRTATVKPTTSPDSSLGFGGKETSEKRTEISKAAVKKALAPSKSSISPSTSREVEISKAAVKKVLAPSKSSISPSTSKVVNSNVKRNRSLKLAAPLKDQQRVRKSESVQPVREQVPEKTLHVIKIETEHEVLESVENGSTLLSTLSPPQSSTLSPTQSSTLSPTQSSPKSLQFPTLTFPEEEVQDESETEYSYTEDDEEYDSISKSSNEGNLEQPEEEDQLKNDRRPTRDLSSNKDPASEKLKFQRGKVVDLESEESGPRRLRFRRGRILGENQESKAGSQRRRFKRRVEIDDTNGTNEGSEKVTLKHQDVQEKNTQGLFNNVIEETASKLVESRKSKVKALVGAFETVISLQESKPSTSG